MKVKINYLVLLFIAFLLIPNIYSLECNPEGLVVGVEVSLDDSSFSNDFDGTKGIIYKLNFDNSLGKYELWLTDNLDNRTDKGNNIIHLSGLNPISNLVDSSDLGKLLKINTSLYNRIYVKEILKNTGTCKDYRYQTLKHYSYLIDVGNSGKNIQLTDFGNRVFYLDVDKQRTEIHSMNIKDFYSGKLRIRSWIRKGSNPYSPTFQNFYVSFWFDGGNVEIPTVSRLTSQYLSYPIVEGETHSINYTFYNPSSTKSKNITYDLRTWSGDANPRLNIYSYRYENTKIDKISLDPLETVIYQYNYTIPYEANNVGLNVYRSSENIRYVDDPILGDRRLLRAWPRIGSLNHSYLASDILKETFVQGTTNDGIPYVGSDYLLKEYNAYYNIDVESGDYDYEILLYKKNSTSGWSNFYTNRSTFLDDLNINNYKKQSLVYPLYDFENWVDNSVRLDMQTYWNEKNWRFFYDTTQRGDFTVDLDFSHLIMSTDLPLYFYPDGGSNELVVRDILFNLKDYILRNVSLNVDIVNPITGISSSDFVIDNPSNFDVPAKSSYPVPVIIKYTGPSQNTNYRININYSYYDEINNKYVSKIHYGDIYIKSNIVSNNYVDLIPIHIDYDNLYLNKNANVEVVFDNFGNSPVLSNHVVSLYYRNFSNTEFNLIDSKSVLSSDNNVNFSFIPTQTGNMIFKAVIDENDDIFENSSYSVYSEDNNVLSSISFVRDINLFLEYARPQTNNITTQGIIPFELYVSNKGTGGIDEFDLNLNISWKGNSWYFNETFYNIPNSGREFLYLWDVGDIDPGAHKYYAEAVPEYDFDFSNNYINGDLSFCPLPWINEIDECFTRCSSSCLDKNSGRYIASCDGIYGCEFYNETFAQSCNGYLEDGFAYFNQTHDAMCPNADIIQQKRITYENINITSEECSSLIIKKYPAFYDGKSVNLNFISCVDEKEY